MGVKTSNEVNERVKKKEEEDQSEREDREEILRKWILN